MGTSSIWHKVKVVLAYHVIPVGDRSAADLFVLAFGASRSGEVMIDGICTFRIPFLRSFLREKRQIASLPEDGR